MVEGGGAVHIAQIMQALRSHETPQINQDLTKISPAPTSDNASSTCSRAGIRFRCCPSRAIASADGTTAIQHSSMNTLCVWGGCRRVGGVDGVGVVY